MPDQDQNHTAKSFSSVWVFLWLQAPAQKLSECLAAKYSTVSSGPYSVLQITVFQSQGISLPVKLAKAKKLHRKWCAFLFVCNFLLSPDSCYLSGTFITFYKNWFLPVFLILQAQKRALLLWPALTKYLLPRVCASIILSTTVLHLHPFFHGWLSNLFSASSSAAKQIQSFFCTATTKRVPPPFNLRICSTPEVSPLFFLPFFPTLPLSGITLCRLGQFPLPFLSHLRRTWVKLVSFPGTSPQHTYCPASTLSLANYSSFHPGPEQWAAALPAEPHEPSQAATPRCDTCI